MQIAGVLPALVFYCLVQLGTGGLIADVNSLKAGLLKGYNKNTLPTNHVDKTFTIEITVGLLDLGDLDEVEEKLTTTIGFLMEWRDESIVWNETEHAGIQRIAMAQADMWLPLLSVRNLHYSAERAAKDKELERVTYRSDGRAVFYHADTIQSTCDLDTTNFPFDRQTCFINMSLSGYIDDNVKIITNHNIKQNFYKDGAWDIVYAKAHADDYRPKMSIRFDFVRKPLFMLLNVLMPTIVLALLTPLVFILPSDSGDRVGFAITTLLAISVYMTIIGDNLPANSDPMPLVTIMLFVWYVLTSSIIFVVVINIKIYNWAGKKPVPAAAQRFVHFVNITWICRSQATMIQPIIREETQACLKNGGENGVTSDNDTEPEVTKPKITWKHVSYAIDRCFMVVFYAVKLLFASLFLIILKYKQVHQKYEMDESH